MTEPYPGYRDIPGAMSSAELNWLYNMAREMESVVEVGSLMGRSTHALLIGCPGTVYSVDLRDPAYSAEMNTLERKGDEFRQAFLENMKPYRNLRILEIDSVRAAQAFPDKSVDMVFIDGDHTEKCFRADVDAWLPKVVKIICGHDYAPFFPDLRRAVKDRFGENFQVIDTIWTVDLREAGQFPYKFQWLHYGSVTV